MVGNPPLTSPRARLTLVLLALAALAAFIGMGNRPGEERLDLTRRSLADAGFPNAQVQRGQSPTNMSRCEVGQWRKRGYAYSWTAGSARGLFCLRLDGRPTRIIVDRARAA
jgi:hypothetical protein